ncbi:hypothetical protein GMLC_14940 [Geomonas limicola]|uniref:HTH cro/C1-type domain-containing protein n=1 Tax=Geomonas limicola TaxID=2740186 RepID=A0A6V8N5R7_9BACT|nr:helix-turn-helix domain-containing protein [Geomonas limicola]GFO67915.1 hypothetical protein GMLC_14940 [Geomonas limicola]
MTQPDRMELLRSRCADLGQAEVARRLKYSPSAINQALKGTYKGDLFNLLTRVEEVFGSTIVDCPCLGKITLGKCAANRRLPFITVNPARVALWTACRACEEKQ